MTDSGIIARVHASSQVALRLNNTGLTILNRVLAAYLALDEEEEDESVSLPYLERSLFRGMIFEPDEWRFVELDNTKLQADAASSPYEIVA